MTTIAFDGVRLAADRQSTHGETPIQTRKLFEAVGPDGRRWIWATAGLAAEGEAFSRCVREGQPLPIFTDLTVLAVDEDGNLWQVHERMLWHRLNAEKWAQGSGANYALGAIEAGADAEEAVRIASALDIHSGLGVDSLAWGPKSGAVVKVVLPSNGPPR